MKKHILIIAGLIWVLFVGCFDLGYNESSGDSSYKDNDYSTPKRKFSIYFVSTGGSHVDPITDVVEGSTITLPVPVRGVYVGEKGGLFMHGGGVLMGRDSYFNMTGGSIHDNEANAYGGGVAIFFGSFLMNGGEIAGNKAWYGGGVYAVSENLFYSSITDTFIKEPKTGELKSGIIWGFPAPDGKENYANGPTVWYDWSKGYYCVYRESTLGEFHAISTEYVWLNYNSNTLIPGSGWEYRVD